MLTDSILQYLSIAFILGLSAGLSPGPLLTLVITQTIKYNRTEGIKVAISPLITDLPIVLLAFYIFNELSQFDMILAIISLLGGVFIAYLAIESFKTKALTVDIQTDKSESIKKGIIANFLNPHPYLFWVTVNAPMVFKAYNHSLLTAILYVITFYLLLVGSKVIVALIIARTKVLIEQKFYNIIMKILGLVLLFFSGIFFYDAIKFFIQ